MRFRAGVAVVVAIAVCAAMRDVPAVVRTRHSKAVTRAMPRDPHRRSRWAWEPGLSLGGDGRTVWVAGNHCALIDQHGVCELDPSQAGFAPDYTPVWRSTNGGCSYRWIADPLKAIESQASQRDAAGALGQDKPGGYDTDVAVAPRARPGRPPLLYVVSAWEGSSTLAVSGDGGRSWRVTDLAGLVPFQDRPWLGTRGACDLYLEYHLFTGSQNIASIPRVERYDGCALHDRAVAGQPAPAPEASTSIEPESSQATRGNQVMAKLAVGGGRLYAAYQQCDTLLASLTCDSPGNRQSVWVAISSDRGASFTDVPLPDAHLLGTLDDGTWPMAAAADDRGHVAVAVVDTHHVVLWTSSDSGRRWRLRRKPVDAGLGWRLAEVPSVAIRGRTVVVAWNGSPPARSGAPQRWYMTVARSDDGGRHFRYRRLDPLLATTDHGTSLADTLYDDFGTAIDRSGAIALAYTQSCAGHSPSDRECPGASQSTQANTLVVRSAWIAGPHKSRHPRPSRQGERDRP